MNDEFSLTIGGRSAPGGGRIEVVNPANERVIAYAPAASAKDVAAAIAAAREAFSVWRKTNVGERREVLRACATRLRDAKQELAALLTAEQGKSLAAADVEIATAAHWCDAVAGMSVPIEERDVAPGLRARVEREPLGVVAAIVPWNFPIGLAFWKIAPALLAGNAVILKPSPYTPLTALRVGTLLRDCVPPGVLNVLSGDDGLGPLLTNHEGVDKISFTGSTATGKSIMRAASDRLTALTLELGGNDAAIVLPSTDIHALAKKLFWAAFRNSGQFCVAAKRIYVHESIYQAFAQELVAFARSVKMGDGAQAGVELGPIQNRRQYDRVVDLIARTRRAGLKFLCGGNDFPRPGYFVPVAIVDDPPDDADVVQEEAFGPIVPLLRFKDSDEVVARANAGPFGLAASVWGDDVLAAQRIAERLDCGTAWVNDVHALSPFVPFGGRKLSGVGSENGMDGLLAYTTPKVIMTRELAS